MNDPTPIYMHRTIPSSVPVDFGNADEDQAVRLTTRGVLEHLEEHNVALAEGKKITMSDGEITVEGICEFRDGIWVAKISREI